MVRSVDVCVLRDVYKLFPRGRAEEIEMLPYIVHMVTPKELRTGRR